MAAIEGCWPPILRQKAAGQDPDKKAPLRPARTQTGPERAAKQRAKPSMEPTSGRQAPSEYANKRLMVGSPQRTLRAGSGGTQLHDIKRTSLLYSSLLSEVGRVFIAQRAEGKTRETFYHSPTCSRAFTSPIRTFYGLGRPKPLAGAVFEFLSRAFGRSKRGHLFEPALGFINHCQLAGRQNPLERADGRRCEPVRRGV